MKFNNIKIKAIISLFLFILFLVIIASGIDLILVEQERILDNSEIWRKIHVFSAVGMTLLIFFHLKMNFKMFVNELRSNGTNKPEITEKLDDVYELKRSN